MAPTTLAIDLAAPGRGGEDDPGGAVDLGLLLGARLGAAPYVRRHSNSPSPGLKSLWSLAQDENARVGELLAQLGEAGVDCIASSPHETETDLTDTEIVELARGRCTQPSWPPSAKSRADGADAWPRRAALGRLPPPRRRALDLAGEDGLIGISVEASPGSFVTASEYVRAVALTSPGRRRRAAWSSRRSSASADAQPADRRPQAKRQHPVEKLGGFVLALRCRRPRSNRRRETEPHRGDAPDPCGRFSPYGPRRRQQRGRGPCGRFGHRPPPRSGPPPLSWGRSRPIRQEESEPMKEARQLDEPLPRNLRLSPTSKRAWAGAGLCGHGRDFARPAPRGAVSHRRAAAEAVTSRYAAGRQRAPDARVFTVVLILFLIGLVTFALRGVAIAYAVVSGMLDTQTGWVKDTSLSFKDLFTRII